MSRSRAFACLSIMLAATVPAAAQKNDYGGYDIVDVLPKGQPVYAELKGWRVFAAQKGGRFAYCFAETDRGDGSTFRVGWDGLQWQLAVPVRSKPDWEGTLQIDGMGSGRGYQSGGDNISGTARNGWTIAWLGEAELDGLRKGKEAVLGVGKLDYDFSLAGGTAATLKVQECVKRSGQTAVAAAQPEPAEAAPKPFGKAGSWVINEIREGRRTVACETYDTSMPNMRLEIDADNSYIDFRDGSDMGNLGDRIPIKVSFGPGSEPNPKEVEIIEGRDGDKWARITESRSDGPGLVDDAIPNSEQISFVGKRIILDRPLTGSNKALDVYFRCSEKIR